MSNEQSVYVVIGSTGEYSNRTEWLVRAFTTETEAQTYVTHLDEMVRVLEVWEQESGLSVYHTSKIDAPGRPSTALDPQFSKDYTGTKYRYEAVPLALEAP